ncbi:MAG: LacI family transcriptional regulator [Chloroflexi bacterium]|nr:LacI family transcriptional regulator [Chloroflexota bacterium]
MGRRSKSHETVAAGGTRRPTRAITSYDVARRAGVSQSAVSRCFKPGASVSRQMRERVARVARELGYTPNAIARSLITRRSHLAGVLISNLTNLYYPEVLSELSQRFVHRGIRLLLFTLPRESDVDQVLDQFWSYRVDGVISAARLSLQQVAMFDQRQMPLVFFNRYLKERPVNAVCCDQAGGAEMLVTRLAAAGHRRFGIIGGPPDSVVGRERTESAQARLAQLGITAVKTVGGNYDYESGGRGLLELSKAFKGHPDAVICANDVMALGCIDFARTDLRLAVPERLSVVGFDGVAPAGWRSYQLTTLRQPVQRMAEAAVSMLLDCIEEPGRPPERRVFTASLVEGGSARLGDGQSSGR